MIQKQAIAGVFILFLLLSTGCTPPKVSESDTASPPVRILLATLSARDTILFKQPFYLISEEARYEFGQRNSRLFIEPVTDGVHIFNNNRNLLYRSHFPIVLEPADPGNHFIFRGQEYAGSIVITPASEISVHLINRLPLEEYLKGVVPAEIFATDQKYFQAIKAQAICARTYALAKIGDSVNRSFDLAGTVSDQVYTGFNRHTDLANRAIQETRGTVLTYNGQLARIYYHSTCGGHLEAGENLFSQEVLPYLKAGSDAVNDIFLCSASPYFRWIEYRHIDELDSAFQANFGKSMLNSIPEDTLDVNLELSVTDRTSGGRVKEITISYADTLVSISGYDIRRFFAQPPDKYLPSTLFYFTQSSDTVLTINGAGNGHGVGMCQYGAINMALRGFQYYHILNNKYFPGTVLTRKY